MCVKCDALLACCMHWAWCQPKASPPLSTPPTPSHQPSSQSGPAQQQPCPPSEKARSCTAARMVAAYSWQEGARLAPAVSRSTVVPKNARNSCGRGVARGH